ncbi:MAG: 3-deoxy-D-manno-octulosonic-acid transferase, partial [Bacteroidota bacterium]|nr:3-deoxy-D-manno-octulosonic-acid transferase [Bacteroidota bacterium]
YEIWANHLAELHRRSIPALLICAAKHTKKSVNNNPFLRAFYKYAYNHFEEIYTAGSFHTEYFESLGLNSGITTLADPRLDRIISKVEEAAVRPVLPKELFADDRFVIVAGSCWQPDEDLIIEAIHNLKSEIIEFIRVIFVPHEPNFTNIKRLGKKVGNCILLSELLEKILSGASAESLSILIENKHIIVDSIGKLLSIYGVADAAYIGGGFGTGLHCVTEPAAYGIPLSSGPDLSAQYDAVLLFEAGGFFPVKNSKEFTRWLREIILSDEMRSSIGDITRKYVEQSRGASKELAQAIIRKIGD